MMHNLFSTPLYHENIGPVDMFTLTYLRNLEYPHEAAGHWHTADKYVLQHTKLKKLSEKIQEHVDNFAFNVLDLQNDITWEIQNSWVNLHRKGEYNSAHWHSNCVFSGVYYVQTDTHTGPITFYKSQNHANLFFNTIRYDKQHPDEYNEYSSESFTVYPKTGDLLIFPSQLQHSVDPNQSYIERISIAFNVFSRGVTGEGTSRLEV